MKKYSKLQSGEGFECPPPDAASACPIVPPTKTIWKFGRPSVAVWGINATTISAEGGGFFGDIQPSSMAMSVEKMMLILAKVLL